MADMRQRMQEMLGKPGINLGIDVDVEFVVDATESMQPLIGKIKKLTLRFLDDLQDGLKENGRILNSLRVQVTVFRDFYVDDKYALEKSPFFHLPEESRDFQDYVANIQVGGGGDDPESGLEALAVALQSDFVEKKAVGGSVRHIICLFTDNEAHPLEQQKDGVSKWYPKDMPRNLSELYYIWGMGQEALGNEHNYLKRMQREAKRMVLFTPNVYPWSEITDQLENVIRKDLDKGGGGKDLDLQDVIRQLVHSVSR